MLTYQRDGFQVPEKGIPQVENWQEDFNEIHIHLIGTEKEFAIISFLK